MEEEFYSSLVRFSADDKARIFRMLTMLGLDVYSNVTGTKDINIEALSRLYVKVGGYDDSSFEENPESLNRVQEPLLTARPAEKGTISSSSVGRIASNFRNGRNNAVFRYPFADDTGHVDRILMDAVEFGRIIQMGAPARKRFAMRVFNDMCGTASKMAVSDIPAALEELGLNISTELLKAISRPIALANFAVSGPSKSIDLNQWYAIVNKCIRDTTGANNLKSDEEPGVMASAISPAVGNNIHGKPSVTIPAKKLDQSQHSAIMPNDPQSIRRQLHTEARVADLAPSKKVQQDKIHWNRIQDERRRASMAAIARQQLHRVEKAGFRRNYPAGKPASSSRSDIDTAESRNYHYNVERTQRGERGGEGGSYRRESRETDVPHFYGSSDREQMRDLESRGRDSVNRFRNQESGSATLEIAEAFLESTIGRDLARRVQSLESALQNKAVGPPESKTRAVEYEEILQRQVDEYQQREQERFAATSSSSLLFDRELRGRTAAAALGATIAERGERDPLLPSLRPQQLQNLGWHRNRGGWAADFGPPHTHSFGRRKQDEDESEVDHSGALTDEMGKKIFRQTFLTTTRPVPCDVSTAQEPIDSEVHSSNQHHQEAFRENDATSSFGSEEADPRRKAQMNEPFASASVLDDEAAQTESFNEESSFQQLYSINDEASVPPAFAPDVAATQRGAEGNGNGHTQKPPTGETVTLYTIIDEHDIDRIVSRAGQI